MRGDYSDLFGLGCKGIDAMAVKAFSPQRPQRNAAEIAEKDLSPGISEIIPACNEF
jgi:hypothetical protein